MKRIIAALATGAIGVGSIIGLAGVASARPAPVFRKDGAIPTTPPTDTGEASK